MQHYKTIESNIKSLIIKFITGFIINKNKRKEIRNTLLSKIVFRPSLEYKKYLIKEDLKNYNINSINKNKNINSFFNLLSEIQNNNIEIFLYYDHSAGGGTESYFYQQVDKLSSKQAILRVQYLSGANLYKITIFYNKNYLFLYDLTYSNLHNLIQKISLKKIFVNNLVGYKNLFEMLNYIKKLKTYKVFLCHDYYSICPSITLMDKNVYCGLPEEKVCFKCFDNNYGTTCHSIIEWRKNWNDFLNNCDEIITFSELGKKMWSSIYPNIINNIIVRPHIVPSLREVNIKPHHTINIGILGNIDIIHKGRFIINNLEKEIKNHKDIKIIVFGSYKPKSKKTKVIKNYNRKDLPNLMEKHDIDIIFIPSIWPETFCYTAEEAMLMGLPVVCFDIGAHAERVKKYRKGLVINLESDIKKILESMILLKFKHKISF